MIEATLVVVGVVLSFGVISGVRFQRTAFRLARVAGACVFVYDVETRAARGFSRLHWIARVGQHVASFVLLPVVGIWWALRPGSRRSLIYGHTLSLVMVCYRQGTMTAGEAQRLHDWVRDWAGIEGWAHFP